MQQETYKPVPGVEDMKFKYEANRIALQDKAGKEVGEITFPSIDTNTVEINHTFVDPSLRGQGLAAKLVEAAVEKLRNEGKKAVPTCSYVKARFEENSEYQSLVPKNK